MTQSFDLACAKCDYSLHGIPASGVCPECGLGVIAAFWENQAQHRALFIKSILFLALAAVTASRDTFLLTKPSSSQIAGAQIAFWVILELAIHILLLSVIPRTNQHAPSPWRKLYLISWGLMTFIVLLSCVVTVSQEKIALYLGFIAIGLYALGRPLLWSASLWGQRHLAQRTYHPRSALILTVAAILAVSQPLVFVAAFFGLPAVLSLLAASVDSAHIAQGLLALDLVACFFISLGAASCLLPPRKAPNDIRPG